MNTEMQRRALAARDARSTLLHLKQVLQDAAETTRIAEMEAAHFAIRPKPAGDISATVRSVLDLIESSDFEANLKSACKNLEIAIS